MGDIYSPLPLTKQLTIIRSFFCKIMKCELVLSVVILMLVNVRVSNCASIHNIIALLEPGNDAFSNLPVLTNKVKAFDIVPELRRMRALSAASGRDFVEAVIGSLSSAVLGKGMVAQSAIYVINWFLSSLSELVPIEVVEYLMGRPLVIKDVQFFEMFVRDTIEVYDAWSRITN